MRQVLSLLPSLGPAQGSTTVGVLGVNLLVRGQCLFSGGGGQWSSAVREGSVHLNTLECGVAAADKWMNMSYPHATQALGDDAFRSWQQRMRVNVSLQVSLLCSALVLYVLSRS